MPGWPHARIAVVVVWMVLIFSAGIWKSLMRPCLHFVGFDRFDQRYWNAVAVFGRPLMPTLIAHIK